MARLETQPYKPAQEMIREWSFILAMQSKSTETLTGCIATSLNIQVLRLANSTWLQDPHLIDSCDADALGSRAQGLARQQLLERVQVHGQDLRGRPAQRRQHCQGLQLGAPQRDLHARAGQPCQTPGSAQYGITEERLYLHWTLHLYTVGVGTDIKAMCTGFTATQHVSYVEMA